MTSPIRRFCRWMWDMPPDGRLLVKCMFASLAICTTLALILGTVSR